MVWAGAQAGASGAPQHAGESSGGAFPKEQPAKAGDAVSNASAPLEGPSPLGAGPQPRVGTGLGIPDLLAWCSQAALSPAPRSCTASLTIGPTHRALAPLALQNSDWALHAPCWHRHSGWRCTALPTRMTIPTTSTLSPLTLPAAQQHSSLLSCTLRAHSPLHASVSPQRVPAKGTAPQQLCPHPSSCRPEFARLCNVVEGRGWRWKDGAGDGRREYRPSRSPGKGL